jgi:hypothetical protein
VAAFARLAVLLLLLGLVLAAGCAAPSKPLPPAWKGRDITQPGWANGTLRTGFTFVLEYVWSSGTSVQWDWFTEGRVILYFQVVRMENGQQVPLVGQHRDNSTGRLTIPQAGQYDVIFRNEDVVDAALHYKLPEGASTRIYPPGEGPGCTIVPLPPVPPVPPALPLPSLPTAPPAAAANVPPRRSC